MKIFINPGHDVNRDSGACGNDMREADVVLDLGQRVKAYLEQADYEVVLLQSDNLTGETPDRPCVCKEANVSGADLFLSIHCNAYNGEARGIETLCFSLGGDGERLARAVQDSLVATLQGIDSTIPDRGIKVRDGLAVLRATNMPAVLAEVAFIDSPEDAVLLQNNKDDIAKALACGVSDFYAQKGE